MRVIVLLLSLVFVGCTVIPKTTTYGRNDISTLQNQTPINIHGTVMQIAAQLERQYPAAIYSVDSDAGVEYVVMVTGMTTGEYFRTRKLSDARLAKDNYFILWAEQLAIRPAMRLVE